MNNTALVIVDIQNDYFPGGAFEQEGADAAVEKAALVLAAFRDKGIPVIHIRHESLAPDAGFFLPGTPGAGIHPLVSPRDGETVVLKHYPNSFRETGLEKELRTSDIRHLVVMGMMTLMCIDSTVRAAMDLGFQVTVVHDACAARALEFNGTVVPAPQVHAAFLAGLRLFRAEMTDAEALVKTIRKD